MTTYGVCDVNYCLAKPAGTYQSGYQGTCPNTYSGEKVNAKHEQTIEHYRKEA